MDLLIADLFKYIEQRHADEFYITDMPALARAFGYDYQECNVSVATSEKTIYVNKFGTAQERHEEAAHEIVHVLADEGKYTDAIRYYHASVPDIDAHVELLTDHSMDIILMPDALIKEVINEWGKTAKAVWELSQFVGVDPICAARRMTFYDMDFYCACVITDGKRVDNIFRNRFRVPFKRGDRLPEPAIIFENGGTLFSVPDKNGQPSGKVICFLTTE